MGNKKNQKFHSRKWKYIALRKARREEKKRKEKEDNRKRAEESRRQEEKLNEEITLLSEVIRNEQNIDTNLKQSSITESNTAGMLYKKQEISDTLNHTESYQKNEASSNVLLSTNHSKELNINVKKTISTYHLVPCTSDQYKPGTNGCKTANIVYKISNICSPSNYTYLKVSEFDSTELIGSIEKENQSAANILFKKNLINDFKHCKGQANDSPSKDINLRLSGNCTTEISHGGSDLQVNNNKHEKCHKLDDNFIDNMISVRKKTEDSRQRCYGNISEMRYYHPCNVPKSSDCHRKFYSNDVPLIHENNKLPPIKTYSKRCKNTVRKYPAKFKLRRTDDTTERNQRSEGAGENESN